MSDRVFKLDEFKRGRILGFTEGAGTTQHLTKSEGMVNVPFPAGSLVLFDNRGTIVGPFSLEGARYLAERVLDGDQRALCDSKSLLILAAAVIGFPFTPDFDETASAALVAEAAHV